LDGTFAKGVHADVSYKYILYVPKGGSMMCDLPPAGRETWVIDATEDGTATWSVNGKELLRVADAKTDLGFKVIVELKGTAEPEARIRLRNLTVEYLKR